MRTAISGLTLLLLLPLLELPARSAPAGETPPAGVQPTAAPPAPAAAPNADSDADARLRPAAPPTGSTEAAPPPPGADRRSPAPEATAPDAADPDDAREDDRIRRGRRGHRSRRGHARRRPRCRGWSCNLRLRFNLEGYYSADMTFIKDLSNLKGSFLPNTTLLREPLTRTLYFTHMLRMEPSLSIGKLATLHLRMDGLQHVVWGDNDAKAQSSLFAGGPTSTSDFGEQVASFQLVWAWLDLDLKLGKLRVGRMPSHWGMGILSNGGGDLTKDRGGVDDDFADNHHPSIYDRILFATKPLQVIKTLAKAKDPSSNWLLAYAYDRLVEEPYWKDVSLEAQRAYGETAFLSRQQNNVDEHVLVLAYSDPKFLANVKALERWEHKSFTAGVYAVYRRQGRYDRILRYNEDGSSTYAAYDCEGADPPPACGARSDIGIVDPYVKLRLGPYLLESESYFIFGKTEPGRGIPIGSEVGKALIYGWVVRAGYNPLPTMELLLDLGQASGDKEYGNEVFRQRPMHADYAPGMILYRMFLRERSATALAQSLNSNVAGVPTPARGLQSNGGVLNSYFLYPRMRWALNRMLTLKVAVLSAWSHRPEQYLYRVTDCEKGAKGAKCRMTENHIGTEVDVGIDVRWGGAAGFEHLFFRFDLGYLFFGKQVADDYNAPGIFALRMRLMFVF